jgi:hypothetical protein
MKHIFFPVFVCLATSLFFISCKKEAPPIVQSSFNLSGYFQKGPFVAGTPVLIQELDQSLSQTGRTFITKISRDDGFFELANVKLESQYVLIHSAGYFFDELKGQLSQSELSLEAIVNLNESETVNVNILTHLMKDRMLTLVGAGKSFEAARQIAQGEVIGALLFPVESQQVGRVEQMNIAEDGFSNAVLLAASIVLSNVKWLAGEQTQFLAQLANDFKDNGKIDNAKLRETLLYNASAVDVQKTRQNILKRYTDMSLPVKVSDFAGVLDKMVSVNDPAADNAKFVYPPTITAVPGAELFDLNVNLLAGNDTLMPYLKDRYCLAARVPFGKTLTVKIKRLEGGIESRPFSIGWDAQPNIASTDAAFTVGEITFKSQRSAPVIYMPIHLYSAGKITVELYENNASTPVRTRNITWKKG